MYSELRGVPQPDRNIVLTRTMSLTNFERFLSDKTLYFSRLDSFKDQSEFAVNIKHVSSYIIPPGRGVSFLYEKEITGGRRISAQDWHKEFIDSKFKSLQTLRNKIFVSCWTTSKTLKQRMWIDKEPGVAIKIRCGKLLDQFKPKDHVFGGLVTYKPIEETYPPANYGFDEYVGFSLVTKDNFYSFEQEFRIVILPSVLGIPTPVSGEINENNEAKQIPLDVNLIEEFVVYGNPQQNELSRSKIREAGFTCAISDAFWTPFLRTPYADPY